jgi:hypothetical protein
MDINLSTTVTKENDLEKLVIHLQRQCNQLAGKHSKL